jgi:hypothetical protein
MEYHPGAYLANKWTCCGAKEKYNRGCNDTFISIEKKAYSGEYHYHYTHYDDDDDDDDDDDGKKSEDEYT